MDIGINNYELLCNKGSAKFNEDIVGLSPHGAWVLDGATGLNNKNLVSSESDAKWYVNWWNEYLYKNIGRNDSLENIMIDGINQLNKEYREKLGNYQVEDLDRPSCSCAIIKFYNDKIEYLILGDCTLFIKQQEEFKSITNHTIGKLDKMVYDAMDKLENRQELSIDEKKAKVMPIIINNRLKKNTQEGYWILEFLQEAIYKSKKGFINIEDNTKIMMTSDGFSCACDRYNIIEKENIIDIASDKGIGYIYTKIREIEELDKNMMKFSRFKISDDSSCIYLDIYKKI